MSPETALALAQTVLIVHLIAALFIIFGIVVIPLGAWLGWNFVHVFWWRLLHLIAMSAVVVQKLLGDACFLSVWEYHLLDIARHAPYRTPLIHVWGDQLIHIDLPMWFFVMLYTILWICVIVAWFRVPPRPNRLGVLVVK